LSAEHELLLEWVSELGSGSWDHFRKANDWLLDSGSGEARPSPGKTAATLSVLGHFEVDWDGGKWAVAPPVITMLPSAGAHAVLVGCRTRHLRHRLDECEADIFVASHAQMEAPDAIFIAASDERSITEVASYLDIHYEFSVSDRLSMLLPTFESYVALAQHSVPTRGFGVQRFEVGSFGWEEVEADSREGLYRYAAYGRPEFRFVRQPGEYLKVDMPLGIYAELRRNGSNIIEFEVDELNGTLVVPARTPLPWLQARCAALCSGLAPSLDRNSWTRRFVNVPLEIAQRIAGSLNQELVVQERSEDRLSEGRPRRELPHIRFSD
jgi:hypothetical protein